jgi:hypothetical protein
MGVRPVHSNASIFLLRGNLSGMIIWLQKEILIVGAFILVIPIPFMAASKTIRIYGHIETT